MKKFLNLCLLSTGITCNAGPDPVVIRDLDIESPNEYLCCIARDESPGSETVIKYVYATAPQIILNEVPTVYQGSFTMVRNPDKDVAWLVDIGGNKIDGRVLRAYLIESAAHLGSCVYEFCKSDGSNPDLVLYHVSPITHTIERITKAALDISAVAPPVLSLGSSYAGQFTAISGFFDW